MVKRGVLRTCLKLPCSVEFELTCVFDYDQIAEFVSQKKYQFCTSDSLLWLGLVPSLFGALCSHVAGKGDHYPRQGIFSCIFADASKMAYGAVCFIRICDFNDVVHCTRVLSTSYSTPKEEASIPRLELMAAVIAVKMDQTLRKELKLPLRPFIFSTDSSLVLQSLQNARKRVPLFGFRRRAFIGKFSCITNWRHVSTKLYAEDCTSRGATVEALLNGRLWFMGLSF